MSIVPVILAGGSGTRLWPLSRSMFPKQFLSLSGDGESMLQLAVKRQAVVTSEAPVLLCNENHRFLVADHLRSMGCDQARILLEPAGRNTAPALALAALDIMARYDDGLLLVQTADHLLEDEAVFAEAVKKAAVLARDGLLVTFGIEPTKPETGYGYICSGEVLGVHGFRVSEFVEKPDLVKAQTYVDSGNYYWNSGMFMFSASSYLAELERFAPAVVDACRQAYHGKTEDLDFIRVDKNSFLQNPDISVDYAVMEKTNAAAVVPLSAGWTDVGSWAALWDIDEKDDLGNSYRGDVLLEDTRNSLIHSTHRLVATLGLDDMVIVDTKDTVLVAHREHVQDVKKIVSRLKEHKRPETLHHREVYRPWGKYDSVDEGHRYQVKRITVKPGAKLSEQMHYHRAEHWIVVKGTARVTVGDETLLLTENQSTHIPIGAKHCLENPGKVPLELIEVQSGPYLGEDDIVRFKDNYGRA